MKFNITTTISALALILAFTSSDLLAAGTSSQRSRKPSVSQEFKAGQKAVKAKDYESALVHLSKALEKDPNSADTHNLIGYSYRKLGNTEQAFEHYRMALNINPKHRGANEYLGELYLETDQLPKAEERLAVLDKACLWGCEEYDDLKGAIEKYKAEKKQ
jgi:Flp pilus assembly protein TadD